jgi:hypothetical protein
VRLNTTEEGMVMKDGDGGIGSWTMGIRNGSTTKIMSSKERYPEMTSQDTADVENGKPKLLKKSQHAAFNQHVDVDSPTINERDDTTTETPPP